MMTFYEVVEGVEEAITCSSTSQFLSPVVVPVSLPVGQTATSLAYMDSIAPYLAVTQTSFP